ncbi:hypothetical protein C8F01DRAFT_1130086, partial [Mycena amicta]
PKPAPDLAQELIDSIVQHIHDPTTLQRCSLVSASFREPAQRNLFKDITITNKNPVLRDLSHSLARNARIARSVRCLSFTYMTEHGALGTAIESWEAHIPTVLSFTVNLTRLLLCSDPIYYMPLPPSLLQRLGVAMAKLPLERISLTKCSFGSSTDLRNLLGGSPHIQYVTLLACQVGGETGAESDLTDNSPLGITTLELMYPDANLVHCVKTVINLASLCTLMTRPQFLDHLLPFATRLQQLTLQIYTNDGPRIDMTGLSQLRQLTVHIGSTHLFVLRYVIERVIALPPSALRDLELIFPLNLSHYPPPREFPNLMRHAGFDGLLVSPSYGSVDLNRLSVVLRSSQPFDQGVLAAAEGIPAVLPFIHQKGLLEVVYEFGAEDERKIICERAK